MGVVASSSLLLLSLSLSLSIRELLALQSHFDTAVKERHRSPLQGPVERGENERPSEQEEPHFLALPAFVSWVMASERLSSPRVFFCVSPPQAFFSFLSTLGCPAFLYLSQSPPPPFFSLCGTPPSRLVLAPKHSEAKQSFFFKDKLHPRNNNAVRHGCHPRRLHRRRRVHE